MKNAVLVIALLLIAFGASFYIYRAKKRGEHCIGCPYAKQCSGKACECSKPESDEAQ